MTSMRKIMQGVMGVVGGVIGLVIVADVVDQNTGTDEAFEDGDLETTVVEYIVPLLALGLIAGAVTIWKFN